MLHAASWLLGTPGVRGAVALVLAGWWSGCGLPPLPESPEDLPPCAALRRQVCGPHDECRDVPEDASRCDRCKSKLCSLVRRWEADHQEPVCAVEARARPEYPVCRAPAPLPTIPPPPLVTRVQCEQECSLPPWPPPAPPRP